MNYLHEIVSYGDTSPYKFFACKLGGVDPHWHQSIEIAIVLSGEVTLSIEERKRVCKPGDIFLVNSNSIHSLHGKNALLATLQVDPRKISFGSPAFSEALFEEELSDEDGAIKSLFAELFDSFNHGKDEAIGVYHISLIYRLIHILLDRYRKGTIEHASSTEINRVTAILAQINTRYAEPLSLAELAQGQYMSEAYLSRFFKKNVGVNFHNYLRSVRLSKAVELLLSGNLSIAEIVQQTGFPNARAFVSAFKEKYGKLPSEYRKEEAQEDYSMDEYGEGRDSVFNYLENSYEGDRNAIVSFISRHKFHQSAHSPVATKDGQKEATDIEKIPLSLMDIKRNPKPLPLSVRKTIGASRLKDVLTAKIQTQLRLAQKEIGFHYLKCHGVFDDDMMVVSSSPSGYLYNWNLIDEAYDFLLSVGLRPIVQLSFMPSCLAKDPSRSVFLGKSVISAPKDIHEWERLVRSFLHHLEDRYGRREIRRWVFSVWNEPSTSNHLFGLREDEYRPLYESTYRTLKSFDPDLVFSGPASFSAYGKDEAWLSSFLSFAKSKSILPDILTLHYYDVDLSWIAEAGENKYVPNRMFLSPKPGGFHLFLEKIHRLLRELHIELPIWVTEWNSTASHQDLLSDTSFKAAYIMKNALENLEGVESFGYWLLSDYNEESVLPAPSYHGGLGLLTYEGYKKPSYLAYRLLKHAEGTSLLKGEGYRLIEDPDGNLRLYLYNYEHYGYEYSRQADFSVTESKRYGPFKLGKSLLFEIDLGTHSKDEMTLERIPLWIPKEGMEAQSLLETPFPKDGKLSIRLAPLEVALLTIKK